MAVIPALMTMYIRITLLAQVVIMPITIIMLFHRCASGVGVMDNPSDKSLYYVYTSRSISEYDYPENYSQQHRQNLPHDTDI